MVLCSWVVAVPREHAVQPQLHPHRVLLPVPPLGPEGDGGGGGGKGGDQGEANSRPSHQVTPTRAHHGCSLRMVVSERKKGLIEWLLNAEDLFACNVELHLKPVRPSERKPGFVNFLHFHEKRGVPGRHCCRSKKSCQQLWRESCKTPCLFLFYFVTCIAAVHISLLADCCQHPVSPSIPTPVIATM